ncbi:MAG TPA: TolC family protein [Vicinamibacterales bacterium]|nr:TolC family protein [Vicinamibacterales bacterium]
MATRSFGASIVFVAAAATASAQTASPLTLSQAEQTALRNHPQIQAAEFGALAATQGIREARAAYFPTVVASFSGADAQAGSRIAAGGLNNPIIYNRIAGGFSFGQLLTDFGRTRALVESSSLNAQAQEQSVTGERASVLLDVDRAYFGVLRAQAVQRVAQATVDARQLVLDQVSALAQGALRSGLDVSFARVNLSTAQLLLVQAQNDTERAFAQLAAALGSSSVPTRDLEDEPLPAAPPADNAALVADAFRQRPELSAARLSAASAASFASAESGLARPSVTVSGAIGMLPYYQPGISDRYAAVGVNVNVPLTNGNLYQARAAEALARARAQDQRVLDVENRIRRDVETAWLNARTAFQRIDLTRELLDQATQALDLAQSRYNLGLSSIVELNQAQLAETQAEVEAASARYDYQVQIAALGFATGARK